MKRDILELIKIYEKEMEDVYDEFSHGDSYARQNAYKIVVADLKRIIADYE